MVTNSLLRIEFIKVVNTKILVGPVIAKHEIDGNQQAVFDRANGAFFPTPSRQTMVLRFEIAVLGAHRRVCHLGEHRVEMAIGSGGFAAAPFAGAFMVTGTAARPRGKVLVGWESTHVGPGLRQQRPSPTRADSCDGIELLYRGTKRGGRYRPQTLAYTGDLLFEKVVLPEQLPQQKAVMLGQLSFQSALQLGNLLAQFALGQLRQRRDILLPGNQPLNHLASRHPQHITGYRAQFDVGGLQYLLDAVVDRVSLLPQLGLLESRMRTHATTNFLCTSNPHARAYSACSPARLLFFLLIHAPPFFGAPRGHPA